MSAVTNPQWLLLKSGDQIKWMDNPSPWMVVGRVRVPKDFTNTTDVSLRAFGGKTKARLLLMNQKMEFEPRFIICDYRPEWSKA